MLDGGGIAGIAYNSSSISNCYNIGIIECDFIEYAGIVGYTGKSQNNKIENNYYLENVINGISNDRIIIDGIEHKTSEELKAMASVLGSAFKQDTNNINNGYPIFSWQ